MNKNKLSRVQSLYRDGVSLDVCISSIIGMSSSDTEASVFIRRFMRESIIEPLQKEIVELKMQIEGEKEKDKDEPTE